MEIVACLYTVAAGRAYISPALSTELLDRRTELFSPAARAITALTPAELPVLRLIARGHTSAEIAAALGKSVKTIENQRSHICQKIGLSGPQALLRFALIAPVADNLGGWRESGSRSRRSRLLSGTPTHLVSEGLAGLCLRLVSRHAALPWCGTSRDEAR